METLSQKELPIEKRFALVVSHNKWLMTKNALLEQEISDYEALKKKYADLKWENENLKQMEELVDDKKRTKYKMAIAILREHFLLNKFLRLLMIQKQMKKDGHNKM